MEKAVVTGELCTEGLPVPLSWEDVGERARVDLLLVPSSTTRTGEALLKEPERIWAGRKVDVGEERENMN